MGSWWRDYASRNLERSTLKVYVSLWNCHALTRLGHLEVRRITPRVIAGFRADLEDAGVGPSSIRKTMAMLQGVFARAIELDRVRFNPLTPVRKPRAARKRAIAALAPVAVERIRALLRGDGRHAEATLVSVLAYAGLRPQEALALEWRHVRQPHPAHRKTP